MFKRFLRGCLVAALMLCGIDAQAQRVQVDDRISPYEKVSGISGNASSIGSDTMVREFCKFIFSREGQEIVVKDGYMPVPYEVAMEELKKLETRSQ